MTTIGALMKTQMVAVDPDASVAEAAQALSENGVGAALVVRDGVLRGILSERDIVSRVVAKGRDPAATKVAEVATADVISVDVDSKVRACAEILRDEGIRHLPVTQGSRPVGILSSRDFFAKVVAGLEGLVERARYEQSLGEGEDPYDHLGGSYGK